MVFGDPKAVHRSAADARVSSARGQVLVEDWWIEYNTVRPHSVWVPESPAVGSELRRRRGRR
jgi:hypothetical protein